MTKNPPHRVSINLTLSIAPNVNHCLRAAAEGKTPPAMIPAEAVAWLDDLQGGGKEIPAIELCGPGDVLASWPATRACLELLPAHARGSRISLTTLGLNGVVHAADLADLGVDRVTVLVDTVNQKTAAKIYRWIRPARKTVPLPQATEILIQDQAEAVQSFTEAGIQVALRTTIQQGINEDEITAIAEKMAELGATVMEITGEGADLEKLARQASSHLTATVFQPEPDLPPPGTPQSGLTPVTPKPGRERPNVAVASSNGMDVDLHLGQAGKLLIYGPRDDGLTCLLDTRDTPPGGSPDRWLSLAAAIPDCFALLASHAGEAPRQYLAEEGIRVILTEDQIEGMVDVLYGGGKKGKCK
ncbi:MAG: radical SAM protein [Desulfobulbaceae bacterium]|nr:radical SAM protein [Desulfobulbaceae bacterium]